MEKLRFRVPSQWGGNRKPMFQPSIGAFRTGHQWPCCDLQVVLNNNPALTEDAETQRGQWDPNFGWKILFTWWQNPHSYPDGHTACYTILSLRQLSWPFFSPCEMEAPVICKSLSQLWYPGILWFCLRNQSSSSTAPIQYQSFWLIMLNSKCILQHLSTHFSLLIAGW